MPARCTARQGYARASQSQAQSAPRTSDGGQQLGVVHGLHQLRQGGQHDAFLISLNDHVQLLIAGVVKHAGVTGNLPSSPVSLSNVKSLSSPSSLQLVLPFLPCSTSIVSVSTLPITVSSSKSRDGSSNSSPQTSLPMTPTTLSARWLSKASSQACHNPPLTV